MLFVTVDYFIDPLDNEFADRTVITLWKLS